MGLHSMIVDEQSKYITVVFITCAAASGGIWGEFNLVMAGYGACPRSDSPPDLTLSLIL